MGRSLSPIESAPVRGRRKRATASCSRPRDSSTRSKIATVDVIHKESRRDASGRVIAQNEAQVEFAVGSGGRASAYLIEQDGLPFPVPDQLVHAGATVGSTARLRYSQTVILTVQSHSTCLFCHANRVRSGVGHGATEYRPPIFEGHAVGCERCHGPGELHVATPGIRRRQRRHDCQPRARSNRRFATPFASNAT